MVRTVPVGALLNQNMTGIEGSKPLRTGSVK